MQKIVFIESVPATPHLETAGELAISLKKKNHKVFFYWVGDNLEWNDWDLPLIAKILGGSYKKKINRFKKILHFNGVKMYTPSPLIDYKKILKWANNFSGNLSNLKNYKYKNQSLGIGVASSIISYYRSDELNLKKYKKKIRSLLISSAIVYERAYQCLQDLNPDFIYTFNNRFATCYPIISAANKLGIKIFTHERGSSYKKFETYSKNVHDLESLKKSFEYYWKKNKSKNKINLSRKYFLNKVNKLDNIENFSFTKNQIKNYLPSFPVNKRIVSFFTSRDYEKASIANIKFNQIKEFLKFKKIIDTFEDIHLVIRVHPTESNQKSYYDDKWIKFSSKKVTVIKSNEKYDSYALLFKSDIVVTYTSSIIIESAYFKKPSISLGQFWWTDYGVVSEPKNNSDLRKMLSKDFVFPKTDSIKCLKIANYFLNYGTKFKYYEPTNKTNGKFLGENLTWKSFIIIYKENVAKFLVNLFRIF